MPFTVVKGKFRPQSGRPDGDTVRFFPDDPQPLHDLSSERIPLKVESRDEIRIRYEGIDTLETGAGEPFASKATAKNIELLGPSDESGEKPGYILTHHLASDGRPVAFLFKGDPEVENGSSMFLTVDKMRESVNFQLIEAGLAYPLFYDTLFKDLREGIKFAADSANARQLGLWPRDQTADGVIWEGRDSLYDLPPVFPKIWRRLEKYRRLGSEADTLDAFLGYLKSRSDRLSIVSESRFTDLDNIIKIRGNTLWLPYPPGDLTFFANRE